jgi:hypothetical protein
MFGFLGSQPPPMPTPEEWAAQAAQAAQGVQLYSQQAMANAQNQNWSSAQNAYPPPPPDYHDRARKLFIDRMCGVRGEFGLKPGDFFHCHLHGDTMFVFFLLGGKEGIVKEAVDVFPSDQLIAQFRMVVT